MVLCLQLGVGLGMARSLPSLAVQPSRVPDEAADDSALADFLRHAVPYEFAGPIPASLLLFGVIGSALLLTTGLLALVLPSPSPDLSLR